MGKFRCTCKKCECVLPSDCDYADCDCCSYDCVGFNNEQKLEREGCCPKLPQGWND